MSWKFVRACAAVTACLWVMPSVSLAMNTAGQADASPSSGTFSYNIPIVIPPGTAGVQPQLALTYSSQSGNDVIGVGWAISGLSAITRCPRTLAQDGIQGTVNFDSNDKYCLDGHRLIAISGVDGGDGTEYRTEIDGFSKVISYGASGNGPTWFKIWTKAGEIIEYGNTADSRIEASGKASIRVWAQNKLSDTKANYFTASYLKNTRGAFVVEEIKYTGNSATGLTANNRVHFYYDARPDLIPIYQAGSEIMQTLRLNYVDVVGNGLLLRTYQTAYEANTSSIRSRLSSITECGSDGTCYPPMTMTWSGASLSTPRYSVAFNTGVCANGSSNCNDADNQYSIKYPDINGDGRADMCFRADNGIRCYLATGSSSGWSTSSIQTDICSNSNKSGYGVCNSDNNYKTITWADVNGDGRDDLVFRADTGIQIGFSTGSSFGNWKSYTICADGSTDYGKCNDEDNYYTVQTADINGDGRADICWRADQGISCALSLGNDGLDLAHVISTQICANSSYGYPAYGVCNDGDNYDTISYADINGDGKADLIYRGDQGLQLWFSTGTAFANQKSYQICANGSQLYGVCNDSDNRKSLRYPDINGDGLRDLCYRSDTGVRCFYSDGTGFNTGSIILTDICANHSNLYGVCNDGDNFRTLSYFADVNGDGLSDLIYRGDEGMQVWFSKGTGFVSRQAYTICSNSSSGCNSDNNYATIDIVDVDGDGQGDLVYRSDTVGVQYWRAQSAYNAVTNLMNSKLNVSKRAGAVMSRAFEKKQWASVFVVSALLICDAAQAASVTRTSAFVYDSAGILVKEVVEPDNSNLCLATTHTLDSYGNETASTVRNCNGSALAVGNEAAAPSGDAVFAARSSSVTYDARGQFPVSKANALSQSEATTYDPYFGTVTAVTGPNGLTTNWAYDGMTRKTLEIRADGTRTKWEYIYCSGVNGGTASCPTYGAYIIQTTPLASDGVTANGPWSKAYFDSLGRAIRTETLGFDGASVVRQDTQYDGLGRVSATSRPYYSGQTVQWMTYTYDALDRRVTTTEPNGAVTTNGYNGLITTVTNTLNQTETRTRDSQGRLASVKDAANSVLTYQYDAKGNLTTTIDPLGNITTAAFDLRGRKLSQVDPDMGTWLYAYNAAGELIRQTDAKGQVSSSQYDLLGRMTKRTEPDLISNWYYDKYKDGSVCSKGIGKLCEAEADNGYDRKQAYDALGRPSQSTNVIDTTYTAGVTYDAQGRVSTQTYPTGLVVKYVYSSLGYLTEVRNNSTNALYWKADTRDAEGHLLQQTFGNNVVTQQTYQASTGRLTGILAGSGNAVQNLSYQYDLIGNITSRSDSNQTLNETFLYDSLNRLTSSTVNSNGAGTVTTTSDYNAIGNINNRTAVGTYIYNASGTNSVRPHAVKEITLSEGGKRQYAYDANGNLTTETVYDAANAVVSWQGRTSTFTSYNMPASLNIPDYDDAPLPYFTYSCKVKVCTFNASSSLDDKGIVDYTWSFGPGSSATGANVTITYGSFYAHYAGVTITDTSGQKRTVGIALNLPDPGIICTTLWIDGICVPYAGSSGTVPTSANFLTSLSLQFQYNAEHQRIRQIAPSGTVIYLHPDNTGGLMYEKETKTGGVIEHRQFISAGGQVVALVKQVGSTVITTYYHSDHLGSVTALTNESGAVVERMAYEPFGRRRQPAGNAEDTKVSPIAGINTDRGFTDHEHLDELGLIHMNGRVYNPMIGRFMSADPQIQDTSGLQNYNRYSYTVNNPLIYTDPSGYSWLGDQLHRFGAEVRRWERDTRHELRRPNSNLPGLIRIAGAYASTACGPWAALCAFGGESALSRAQGLGPRKAHKNGLIAAIQVYAAGKIGDYFETGGGAEMSAGEQAVAHATAHGVLGGAVSVAQGGDFGSGFASGAFTAAVSPYLPDGPLGVVGAAVVGGTGSVLTGGKFSNGAVTGAFGYLFNYCMHGGQCTTGLEQALYDWMPGYKVGTCISNGDCSAGEFGVALAGTAIDVAGGAGMKATEGASIVFKTEHVVGRLEKAGLSVDAVKAAVEADIRPIADKVQGWFANRISVQGHIVEYRAVPRPGGGVSVGTMFKVEP